MKFFYSAVLLNALFIFAPLPVNAYKETSYKLATDSNFENLKFAVQHKQISRFVVMHLSNSVRTGSSIDPDKLESIADNTYSKTKGLNRIQEKAWTRILGRTIIVKSVPGWSDFRWGILFYNKKNIIISAIYIDGSGHNAQVNGKIVGIKGDLYPWLVSTFGPLMD